MYVFHFNDSHDNIFHHFGGGWPRYQQAVHILQTLTTWRGVSLLLQAVCLKL